MNRAKDVAVYDESAWYSCCEDNSVGIAGRQDYPSVKVSLYRKPMRLRRVFVAHKQTNNIALMNMNYGPRVQRRSMTDAIVEA